MKQWNKTKLLYAGNWIDELPHELPDNLRFGKLRNFKKVPEMLGTDGEHLVGYPKRGILIPLPENYENYHSIDIYFTQFCEFT